MNWMRSKMGQTMTEYILIIAVIALAVVVVIKTGFADKIKKAFTGAGQKIEAETK